jgi:hypothetical protein
VLISAHARPSTNHVPVQAPQFNSAKPLCHAHAHSIALYDSDLLFLSSLTSGRDTRVDRLPPNVFRATCNSNSCSWTCIRRIQSHSLVTRNSLSQHATCSRPLNGNALPLLLLGALEISRKSIQVIHDFSLWIEAERTLFAHSSLGVLEYRVEYLQWKWERNDDLLCLSLRAGCIREIAHRPSTR